MRKVLVVEDDRFIATIFSMFIKELGHEMVACVKDGKDAIEFCKTNSVDVILMDIHLDGEMDGIQTAEFLQREKDIPVIYVSSDTSSQVIKRAIVSNSYGFLVKPINKKELGICIDLAFYKHHLDLEQKKREQNFRAFISESPVPIIVVKDGNIIYVNRLGLDLLKTHYIEDVIDQPFTKFVTEEFIDKINSILQSPLEHFTRSQAVNMLMKTVHGRVFKAEIIANKVIFNSQDAVQVIIHDISKEELLKSEINSMLEAWLDSTCPFAVLSDQGKLIEANNSFLSLIDESLQKISFKNIKEIFENKPNGWSCDCNFELPVKNKAALPERFYLTHFSGKRKGFKIFVSEPFPGEIHEIVLVGDF